MLSIYQSREKVPQKAVLAFGGLNKDTLRERQRVTQQQRTWRKYSRNSQLHFMATRFCAVLILRRYTSTSYYFTPPLTLLVLSV